MITGNEIHTYLGLRSTDDSCGVYVGWQQIGEARAQTKIGRSKNAQAIQRGRQQGGANWWFAGYFLLPDLAATRHAEREIAKALKLHRIKKTVQRQTELYSLNPDEACAQVESVLRSLGYEIRDVVDEILETRMIDAT